jgi:hypothetical protein
MDIASQLLNENSRPEWCNNVVEVKRVVEAGEPILFREKFSDWPDNLPIGVDTSNNANIAGILDYIQFFTFIVVQKIEKYDVNKMYDSVKKPEDRVDDGEGEITMWVVNGFNKELYEAHGTFYR